MSNSSTPTADAAIESSAVLFFRTYREVQLPLYTAMVNSLCASQQLPHELATTLEDIGQVFVQLSERLNAELIRRGVFDDEADADGTVEARINAMVEAAVSRSNKGRMKDGSNPFQDEVFVQAIRTALVMVHDLPIACAGRSGPVGQMVGRGHHFGLVSG